MRTGEASKILGWLLIQLYEKQGDLTHERDHRNWRGYKREDIFRLRDRLLGFLREDEHAK